MGTCPKPTPEPAPEPTPEPTPSATAWCARAARPPTSRCWTTPSVRWSSIAVGRCWCWPGRAPARPPRSCRPWSIGSSVRRSHRSRPWCSHSAARPRASSGTGSPRGSAAPSPRRWPARSTRSVMPWCAASSHRRPSPTRCSCCPRPSRTYASGTCSRATRLRGGWSGRPTWARPWAPGASPRRYARCSPVPASSGWTRRTWPGSASRRADRSGPRSARSSRSTSTSSTPRGCWTTPSWCTARCCSPRTQRSGRCCAASSAACSSTSTKTPTPRRSGCCRRSPATAAIWSRSAIPTSRSTPSAAPTSGGCSPSRTGSATARVTLRRWCR